VSADEQLVVPTSLAEVAESRERWRAEIEAAEVEVEETKAPYLRAVARLENARRELQRTELALNTAKRMHLIGQAVEALGVQTDEPPVVLAKRWEGETVPRVYELVALGSNGEGLYRHVPSRSHRYEGKAHAIRARWVPEEVKRVQVQDKSVRLSEREAALQALGLRRSAALEVRPVHGTPDLWYWQERGRGDFGDGSGSLKPTPPPSGGRWRWLKVNEQQELPA
jgi:hypothetical protein